MDTEILILILIVCFVFAIVKKVAKLIVWVIIIALGFVLIQYLNENGVFNQLIEACRLLEL